MAGKTTSRSEIKGTVAILAAFVVLYAGVFLKLGIDWYQDENYSHGLLIPFVVGLIIWLGWEELKNAQAAPRPGLGMAVICFALLLLVFGTLGAELFSQRISLILMLAGLVTYLYGLTVLRLLVIPLVLFLLAIPIPQIIFNKIAFPLQLLASQIAVWAIRLIGVPGVRSGNVIDILPAGSTQTIALEVVEACSGIRSLMTLVSLALILVIFTRDGKAASILRFGGSDVLRAILLMIAAVPIAVLTNSFRVTATAIGAYHYGKQAISPFWHDISGWAVYAAALLLLFAANIGLKALLPSKPLPAASPPTIVDGRSPNYGRKILLATLIAAAALAVNWFAFRTEAVPPRMPLDKLGAVLGDWHQRGGEIKFSEATENILRASDYTMREYVRPDGRVGNIYVGFFGTQRTGTTIHSPQNCLPGAGWVLSDRRTVTISPPGQEPFEATRYIIESGIYKEVMIYWYQGRGRTASGEFRAKFDTVIDSIVRRRSDGAIVRVMTSVGNDEKSADEAAIDLAERLASELPNFIPN